MHGNEGDNDDNGNNENDDNNKDENNDNDNTNSINSNNDMLITIIITTQFVIMWPLLLTWFNFNPSMDK